MGGRNYRRREPKKPKKGAKKPIATLVQPPVAVEVIKKGKKAKGEEQG